VVSAAPPPRVESCDCTLKWVPESWFLSSLQDEFGSRSVTGGAPDGDHRLISAILSGLIAGISTAHVRAHNFASNAFCPPQLHRSCGDRGVLVSPRVERFRFNGKAEAKAKAEAEAKSMNDACGLPLNNSVSSHAD
jgi:hypothetical protein